MKIIVSTIVIGVVSLSAVQALAKDPQPGAASAQEPGAVSSFFASMGRDLVRQSSVDPKAARRKAAGKLVADGKCDEAMKMALEAGDIELAANLKTLCATPVSTAAK